MSQPSEERRGGPRIPIEMWVEETTGSERYFRRAGNLSRGRSSPRAHHSVARGTDREPHLHACRATIRRSRSRARSSPPPAPKSCGWAEIHRPEPGSASPDRRFPRSRGRARRGPCGPMTRRSRSRRLPPRSCPPRSRGARNRPKPLEPRHTLKPPAGDGYFDDVFALDAEGKRLAVIRTDGATFSKLEIYDAAAGKRLGGFDLPSQSLVPRDMELLRRQRGRRHRRPRQAGRRGAAVRVSLRRRRASDRQGRPRDRVRPAARRRMRARAAAGRLHAQARRQGRRGDLHRRAVRHHDAGAGRQAARPPRRRHRRAEAAGRPLHRFLRRLHPRVQRAPGRLRQEGRRAPAVQDGDRRRDHRQGRQGRPDRRPARVGPDRTAAGRSTWAGRCSSSSTKMGPASMWLMRWARSSPLELAVPFHLYDPKSLRVEEGPGARAADVRPCGRSGQQGCRAAAKGRSADARRLQRRCRRPGQSSCAGGCSCPAPSSGGRAPTSSSSSSAGRASPGEAMSCRFTSCITVAVARWSFAVAADARLQRGPRPQEDPGGERALQARALPRGGRRVRGGGGAGPEPADALAEQGLHLPAADRAGRARSREPPRRRLRAGGLPAAAELAPNDRARRAADGADLVRHRRLRDAGEDLPRPQPAAARRLRRRARPAGGLLQVGEVAAGAGVVDAGGGAAAQRRRGAVRRRHLHLADPRGPRRRSGHGRLRSAPPAGARGRRAPETAQAKAQGQHR